MQETNLKLAKNLGYLMKRDRHTLTALADLAGIPVSTLCDWRSGRNPRDLSSLKRLAEFFKMTVDSIAFADLSALERPKDFIIEGRVVGQN